MAINDGTLSQLIIYLMVAISFLSRKYSGLVRETG